MTIWNFAMHVDTGNDFVVTDTATLCVYDLEQLHHRLEDDNDWWVEESERKIEEDLQHVVFMDVKNDGKYRLFEGVFYCQHANKTKLRVTSGRVFIGAAEEITGDHMEPTCTRGGRIILLRPGAYTLYWMVTHEGLIVEYKFERTGD